MRSLLLVVAMFATVCAGCSAEAPGQPLPAPSATKTVPSISTSQTGQAPPINSLQLDLASYIHRVCDLLTPAQLTSFAIRSPGVPHDESGIGHVCTWKPPDSTTGVSFDLTVLSDIGYGWEGIYQRKNRWAKFENAGEINGYPAVHLLATKIDEETGICLTAAGVNRDVVFEIDVNVNDIHSAAYKMPCSVSDRVAGLVIDTLKGGR